MASSAASGHLAVSIGLGSRATRRAFSSRSGPSRRGGQTREPQLRSQSWSKCLIAGPPPNIAQNDPGMALKRRFSSTNYGYVPLEIRGTSGTHRSTSYTFGNFYSGRLQALVGV
ncbi:predicted protein [Uncinocarpus reesii 1704]|uniref:Uncharacterized protein n=1 Tax=Uncinocarpus reesii (strain UAMH 1704) TaxID=336963 RepID=C4JFA9_UNCRE|nr:uncharacterized protein UREG_02331 [Uncinocarpus reesii 1704]EEP77482.1 predicted protein [Uncinocarpus reesii 1704]